VIAWAAAALALSLPATLFAPWLAAQMAAGLVFGAAGAVPSLSGPPKTGVAAAAMPNATVAAKASAPLVSVSDDGIADWVTALSASEKDKFLTMVAEGEGAQVEALLVRRFRRESRPAGTTPASTGRTAGELLAAAEARRAAREQAEARAKEQARAGRAAEQAAAYERHLQNLTGRKEETWQQVAELTVFSKPKEYDQATQLLRDLHVIAQREDDITAFTARVRELRTRYGKRPSLMDRLDKAGLP